MYNPIHQEQIAAEPESLECAQQGTVENIFHVPIPQMQEQFVESVQKIPQERLLFERIEEQIGDILVPPVVEETVEVLQRSVTAVEVSAPQVDGSRPRLVEVTVPMYNQDHQEQLVASEQITHVPVPQIQDPVECDEPLAIGDMVVDTSFGLSPECEIIRIGYSLYNGQNTT